MCLLQRQILGGTPNLSGAITVDTGGDLVYDFCKLFCLEKKKNIYMNFVILCSYGNCRDLYSMR